MGFIRCSDCNALVFVPPLTNKREQAICPHCHKKLRSGNRWSLQRCAIIASAILILMPFALLYPLLNINLLGERIDASVWTGIWKMAIWGYPYTAFLVFICAIIMPTLFSLLVIMLRIAKWMKLKPRNILSTITFIKPWVMFDVYFLSLGVAAFKVREYASLNFDIYLIAFIFTALLTTLLFIKINPSALWAEFYPDKEDIENLPTTLPHSCGNCDYTFEQPSYDRKGKEICPRCHSNVNQDPLINLQRTWATLIAGIIMLFPANLLPISMVYMAGVASGDTLMSGVLSFIGMGSYFIAFVVFTASIFVPISKAIIMLYLLLAVHLRWQHSIHFQMKLFHIVHFVGRWSMLDLFVLALMMSLVTRGQIINFSVGPAAFYFGAAVFSTMLSTTFFDSRLLWDIYDKRKQHQ